MILKRISIKATLALLVSVCVLGLIALGLASHATLNAIKVTGPYYQRIVQGKDLIADINSPRQNIVESYLTVLQLLDEPDPAERQRLIQRSRDLRHDYEDRHRFWASALSDPQLKEVVTGKAYQPAFQFFDIRDRDFIPAVTAGNVERARDLASGILKRMYADHQTEIEDVIRLARERSVMDEVSAATVARSRSSALVALGGLILVLVSFISWFLVRRIVKPLGDTARVLAAVASGDLTRSLEVTSQDEIGEMTRALNQAIDGMRTALQAIAHAARSLAGSSRELKEVAEQISADTEETAGQANLVSAASEQVSRNVQTVAIAADEMGSSIREIAKNASDAARVATEAVKVAEVANASMRRLGESSAEIGTIVSVINAIAGQTKLLALNATIEAARAGEAGKGFVVVANEVKELAKETGKATEDIGHKIGAIQSDTQGAAAAIVEISGIINRINDIFTTIASAVEQQAVTTGEIGRNVADAAKSSSEIAEGIMAVARGAQSTTIGANHTRTAAGNLAQMAAGLHGLVGRFRHEGAAEMRPAAPEDAPAPTASSDPWAISVTPGESDNGRFGTAG
jgi:methyl-accepting chemotaxis protein